MSLPYCFQRSEHCQHVLDVGPGDPVAPHQVLKPHRPVVDEQGLLRVIILINGKILPMYNTSCDVYNKPVNDGAGDGGPGFRTLPNQSQQFGQVVHLSFLGLAFQTGAPSHTRKTKHPSNPRRWSTGTGSAEIKTG